MKALIFEHKDKFGMLCDVLENSVIIQGGIVVQKTGHINQAIKYLDRGDIDLVVIHHNDFSEVDEMRKKFPKIKYAGYSGLLRIPEEFAHRFQTMNEEFVKRFKLHYDYVLTSPSDHLYLTRQA